MNTSILESNVELINMPADLDLYEYLVKTPTATYMARASGHSMIGVGVQDKDLLILDRSLIPKQGDIIIACINDELTLKIYDKKNQRLLSANNHFAPIVFADYEYSVFTCEGVLINSIHSYI